MTEQEKLLLEAAKGWKSPGPELAYLSVCPALAVLSALMRVSAAAASSNAQLTEDVSLRSTSGSAKAFPSAVDSFPIPAVPCAAGGDACQQRRQHTRAN